MALTAHPPAPAAWSRWPQHHPNGEYHDVMMNPGVMSYDSRSTTSAPLERPLVAHNFFPGPSYTAPPTSSMNAPQYLPGLPPVTYGGYASFPTSPVLGSPFKQQQQHYPERPQLPVISATSDMNRGFRDFRESMSPSIKSESRAMSVASKYSTSPSTVSSTLPGSSLPEVSFNTRVDALMKAIQSKSADSGSEDTDRVADQLVQHQGFKMDMLSQQPLPPLPHQEHIRPSQAARLPSPTQSQSSKSKAKRYACHFPDCGKFFSQKTHLDTHTRSHTGEQPYVCTLGCGKRFSQLGNQKIHERRHRGEKPYQCDKCGKKFTQHGTLMAHGISHSKAKPYSCILDNCNKKFTQRGNLKSHQNKFHSATLEALIKKFATMKPSEVSSEDKELWEYFANLYKNSNKGIKGRGKHHKVKLLSQVSPTLSTAPPPAHHAPRFQGLPQILTSPQQPFYPSSLPPHGMIHLSSYARSSGRPSPHQHMGHHNPRDLHHGPYDMIETEDESVMGSATSSATAYDDDHHRELAFGDRMY